MRAMLVVRLKEERRSGMKVEAWAARKPLNLRQRPRFPNATAAYIQTHRLQEMLAGCGPKL